MTKIDPYPTHLPYLTEFARGNAVEFGCGLYSTPTLLNQCDTVVSIEMQDPEWLTKVSAEMCKDGIPESWDWRGVESIGAWHFLGVEYPDQIDFALVDGHRSSRYACVNFMMRLKVPVIVAHDTEALQYKWEWVYPYGYRAFTFKETTPGTTVWVREDLLTDAEFLSKHQTYVQT